MKRLGCGTTRILGCTGAVLLAGLLAAPALGAQTQNTPGRQAAGQRQLQRLRVQRALALGQAARMLRGIGLTDEQRQQLRDLRQQRRPQVRELAQKLGEARRGLRAARQASPVDEAAIKQIREQSAKLRQEAAALRKGLRADALQLLTPEQQEKLKARAGQLVKRRR